MAYIELRNITKTFYGVKALDNVSLSFEKGEVHAVVGENGAGKSTIMKILGGLYFADSGEIWIDGTKRAIHTVGDAQKNGVSVVYQELNFMPDLTVAENIYLGRLPQKGVILDKQAMNRNTQSLLDEIGVNIKATALLGTLSVSQQQMLEIGKALSYDADIIIMDEPTAALNTQEVETLYRLIARLKQQGKTVIYISHRLKEIFDLTDRCSVLRDGTYIGTWETAQMTQDMLVSKMVGREISQFYTTASHAPGEVVLEVQGLTKADCYSDISFSLRKGEILGIAGLMGCKREEIVKTLYGLLQADAGKIVLNGKEIRPRNPREAMQQGIGFVTEDRKQSGIFALMSVRENITINVLKSMRKLGLLQAPKEQELLAYYTQKMNMKYSGHYQRINSLSGGNQQKFVLARALAADCKILILLEPTRGIDVGAKSEIYALIESLAQQGLSIIMVSSEMPEIMENCHRTLVVFQGGITGNLPKEQFDETLIMQCATGTKTATEGGVA